MVTFRKSNGERLICLKRTDGVDDFVAEKSVTMSSLFTNHPVAMRKGPDNVGLNFFHLDLTRLRFTSIERIDGLGNHLGILCYSVILGISLDSSKHLFYAEYRRKPKTRSFPVRSTPRWDLRHSWAS